MVSSTDQAHPRLPNATSTTPYWRTQPHSLDEFCSSSTVPDFVDVAIVGGGIAGASTAYHLLIGPDGSPYPSPPSIAIFEARQACSGATGRNGGHTKLGPVYLAGCNKKHGPAATLHLALFVRKLLREMRACAESIVVDDTTKDGTSHTNTPGRTLAEECEMLATKSWDVFLDETQAIETEREWKEAVRGMKEVAKKEGREQDLDWLGDVQFLRKGSAEQVSDMSTKSPNIVSDTTKKDHVNPWCASSLLLSGTFPLALQIRPGLTPACRQTGRKAIYPNPRDKH